MAPWRKDISLCIYPYVKNTQMPVTEGQVIFASAPLPLPRHQCYFCFWYLKVKADSLPAGHVCQSLSLNTSLISPGQNSSPKHVCQSLLLNICYLKVKAELTNAYLSIIAVKYWIFQGQSRQLI